MRLEVNSKKFGDYGRRVQKSVFECRMDERNFVKMKGQAEKIINPEVDSVRYYFLCGRCQANIQISGWGTVTEDEDISIV